MSRNQPKLCGYSTRHLRRIINNRVKQEEQSLRNCRKKKRALSTCSLESEIICAPSTCKTPEKHLEREKCETNPDSSPESDNDLPLESHPFLPSRENETQFKSNDFKLASTSAHLCICTEDNLILSQDNRSDCLVDSDDENDSLLSFDDNRNCSFSSLESTSNIEDEDYLEESNEIEQENSIASELKQWALTFKISLLALTAMLLILRLFSHADLFTYGRSNSFTNSEKDGANFSVG